MLVTRGAAALPTTVACALALVGTAAGAMPGLASTPGFGVPTQAALSGETYEHCNDDSQSFTFNPVSMEGCKAKCLELYPAVGAAEFKGDETKCCCQGLTTAQGVMNWCHYPNTGSQAYYFKACTQAEPTACISDSSLSSEQKLAIYTGGTYECTAPAPSLPMSPPPSPPPPSPSPPPPSPLPPPPSPSPPPPGAGAAPPSPPPPSPSPPPTGAAPGTIEWVIPTDGLGLRPTFAAGDTLTFTWSGAHNVYLLPSCDGAGAHAFDAFTCPTGDWGTLVGSSSPATYTIPTAANDGDYFCFTCSIGSHCALGQHATVQVSGKAGCAFDDIVAPSDATVPSAFSGTCKPGYAVPSGNYCQFHDAGGNLCASTTCTAGAWSEQLVCGATAAAAASSPSPPRPPPTPPETPPPAAYAVTMAVTLDASISDVTDSVLVALRQKVADEAGVPLDAVTATASAGSVLVAFTIHLQNEAAADTALSAVGAQLADTTAASAFLSTASLTVTVTEISAAPAKVVLLSPPPSAPPPSPAPAPPPPSSGGVPVAAIGGAVGGAVVLLLLIGVVLVYMKKRKKGRVYVAEANVKNAGSPILATPPQEDAMQSK